MRYPRAMYTIDGHDQVRELTDFPQQDVGAPLPLVFATEQSFALVYYLNGRPERFALVEFESCWRTISAAPTTRR